MVVLIVRLLAVIAAALSRERHTAPQGSDPKPPPGRRSMREIGTMVLRSCGPSTEHKKNPEYEEYKSPQPLIGP